MRCAGHIAVGVAIVVQLVTKVDVLRATHAQLARRLLADCIRGWYVMLIYSPSCSESIGTGPTEAHRVYSL